MARDGLPPRHVPDRRRAPDAEAALYSCLIGTALDILLRGLRVDTLLLVGAMTDVCVHYTYADAHRRDHVVHVVEDAVYGSRWPAPEAALDAMEYLQRGARITTDQLCDHLATGATAGVPG